MDENKNTSGLVWPLNLKKIKRRLEIDLICIGNVFRDKPERGLVLIGKSRKLLMYTDGSYTKAQRAKASLTKVKS